MRFALILAASLMAGSCTTYATRVVCKDGDQEVVQKIVKFDDLQFISEPFDQTCQDGQWVDDGHRGEPSGSASYR